MAHHPFLLPKRPAHSPCPGATRVSQVPGFSLHASHALWTPADPPSTHHSALFVLASDPLTPSPSAFRNFRPSALSRLSYTRPGGVRPPLRATWFPVYASIVSFGFVPVSVGLVGLLISSPFPVECLNLPDLELPETFTSSTTATLGMGGWLALSHWGLAPQKKRQVSLAH